MSGGLYSRMSFICKYKTSTLTPFVKPCNILNLAIQNIFYTQLLCMESAFTYNLGVTIWNILLLILLCKATRYKVVKLVTKLTSWLVFSVVKTLESFSWQFSRKCNISIHTSKNTYLLRGMSIISILVVQIGFNVIDALTQMVLFKHSCNESILAASDLIG